MSISNVFSQNDLLLKNTNSEENWDSSQTSEIHNRRKYWSTFKYSHNIIHSYCNWILPRATHKRYHQNFRNRIFLEATTITVELLRATTLVEQSHNFGGKICRLASTDAVWPQCERCRGLLRIKHNNAPQNDDYVYQCLGVVRTGPAEKRGAKEKDLGMR